MTEPKLIAGKDVERLVKKGERQGYLTPAEVFAVLSPDLVEELDELMGQLQRLQVIIVDTPEEGARLARERRGISASEPSASDALSSYLREIAQLPSLGREAEIQYAQEYHAGIQLALRAVATTRFFVDRVLLKASQIRRGKLAVWEVVDRLRYSDQEDTSAVADAFTAAVQEVGRLHQLEKRILGQLGRRGLVPDKARSLSDRLRKVRSELADRLLEMHFEPRFMKEIASDMMALISRLQTLEAERAAIAETLKVSPEELSRALRSRSLLGLDPSEEADVQRRHRNLQRKIRRQEKQAGMSFDAMRSTARNYRSGILRAQRARDALILSAQRLVLSSARYYGRRLGGSGMEVADLISAGNLGLIRAVELFDPERGNRFSTFAGHWVRHAMIRTIHTQSRTVYVPPHIRQQMSKILAVENELIQRSGRSPTDDELARASDMDVPRLRHTIQSFGRMSSIDRPLDPGDSGSATYGDILADDKATPDEELEGAERREMVRQLADRLQGRERTIVFLRMGWTVDGRDVDEPKTLAEIGEEFGISRQRVEQLEKRALSKLRRWARASGLGDPVLP